MPRTSYLIVFVHGWSVTDINTYGGLPYRLQNEAKARHNINIRFEDIFLGEYISFHDEIRVGDIARAFNKAVLDKLSKYIDYGYRFICITHSTGGPVIREWWKRYYKDNETGKQCPMSHLIMLAPANFGSALAKLGKKQLSRFLSEIKGIEPGTGVLEWLELGSRESWLLNQDWIDNQQTNDAHISENGIFPFVITGEYIDRKLYDHAIPFTGEAGSDGVVRAAAANLNAGHVTITQTCESKNGLIKVNGWKIESQKTAPRTPFLIVLRKSHSGNDMGIMKSIKPEDDPGNKETISAIINCMLIKNKSDYLNLCDIFDQQTSRNQDEERLELPNHLSPLVFWKRHYLHDAHCMVIFRVKDSEGFPVPIYEAILTSGPENSADYFPVGFMGRKQKNENHPGVLTYYLNYDKLHGAPAVPNIRAEAEGINSLGLNIYPYPSTGFVRYEPLMIQSTPELFKLLIVKNSTVLVDIVLQRLVSKETFELNDLNTNYISKSFREKEPGTDAVE